MVPAVSPPIPALNSLPASQTVFLNFLGVNWPHIGVATLTKQ